MPEFVKRIVELTQQGYEVCPYISRGSFGLSYTIGYKAKEAEQEVQQELTSVVEEATIEAVATPVKKAGRPAKT